MWYNGIVKEAEYIKQKISRTERILSVYHLFMCCREVSFKEVTDLLPVGSSKTISRDIQLLKSAGVLQTRYSKKAKAFIPLGFEFIEPDFPEKRGQKMFMEKIRRLCILMYHMQTELWEFHDEKPLHIELYKELFPNVSASTRRRDFDVLCKIGYEVYSDIEDVYDEKSDTFVEKTMYSSAAPVTYSLSTFTDKARW